MPGAEVVSLDCPECGDVYVGESRDGEPGICLPCRRRGQMEKGFNENSRKGLKGVSHAAQTKRALGWLRDFLHADFNGGHIPPWDPEGKYGD